MTSQTFEVAGVRVAVEGCGHGLLDAIYGSVERSCKERGWDGVDLVIIGGDFQATRNASDLTVMSVPAKYRAMGDFHAYYSGARTAPYLTVFVGGNHEAAAYLAELYYGGWVAPNIYYFGAANVLRLGPLRLAGLSGIWKGFDYRRPHVERLPFSQDDVKSFYHVRELDVRKLLQVREPIDVGLSHDWPRGVENHGDLAHLLRMKPHFRGDAAEGQLGSPAAEYVMDRLRPSYWFSAHMHCKFSAIRQYEAPTGAESGEGSGLMKEGAAGASRPAASSSSQSQPARKLELPPPKNADAPAPSATTDNPDEIDLDLDDDEVVADSKPADTESTVTPAAAAAVEAPKEANGNAGEGAKKAGNEAATISNVDGVSSELLAQLPASFLRPQPGREPPRQPRLPPGQPVPPTITNTTVRFLALDKCLPGRHFLQLMKIPPIVPEAATAHPPLPPPSRSGPGRYRLEYDPEWLAITRVFHPDLVIGGGDDPARPSNTPVPPDRGEAHYRPLIDAERAWVEENIVAKNLLQVPENFAQTAPVHTQIPGRPETYAAGQPDEYTNPQTAAFCALVGLPNLWDAPAEERTTRKRRGPAASHGRGIRSEREGYDGSGRGGGGGGGYGRGRGRGRGGRGRW